MTRTFLVAHDNPNRAQVCERAIQHMRDEYRAGRDFEIIIREPARTLDQNSAMWPTLTDFARSLDWPHTRSGLWVVDKMGPGSWKAVMTAAFEGRCEMAQGWHGESVMVGASTSKYGKKKFGDLLTYLHAEGTDRGVRFSDKALEDLAQWAPAERRAPA